MEGFEPAQMEDTGEEMMAQMMAQFETLGEKEDYNEVNCFRLFIISQRFSCH